MSYEGSAACLLVEGHCKLVHSVLQPEGINIYSEYMFIPSASAGNRMLPLIQGAYSDVLRMRGLDTIDHVLQISSDMRQAIYQPHKPLESVRYCEPRLIVKRRYSEKVSPDACLKKFSIFLVLLQKTSDMHHSRNSYGSSTAGRVPHMVLRSTGFL